MKKIYINQSRYFSTSSYAFSMSFQPTQKANKPKRSWDRIKGKIRLGLCCINTVLRKAKPPVFCSRTVTRKNFTVNKAKQLALQNVQDILKMIEWNEQHGIKCLRLSSDIFPHFTDEKTEKYDLSFAHEDLKKVGELAKKYGHRLLMHPGQFNQVGAKSEKVFQATIDDLSHHADILDAIGIDDDGVLIVHGGGTYGNKEETMNRWIGQYFLLPPNVQSRLVIENCERQYSIQDCLYISKEIELRGGRLPVVFDSHHYACYKQLHLAKEDEEKKSESILAILDKVVQTWKNRRPVMHISNQGSGKIGHHSDYITSFPKFFFSLAEKRNVSFDLEVEAKMKEQAIFKLYEKFPRAFNV